MREVPVLFALTLSFATSPVASAQSTAPSVDLHLDVSVLNAYALVAHQTETLVLTVTTRGTATSGPGTVSIALPPDLVVTQVPYLCTPVQRSESEYQCRFFSILPGGTGSFADLAVGFEVLVDRGAGEVAFEAKLSARDGEVAPANARRFVTMTVFDDPGLHPVIEGPDRLDGQNRGTIRYSVENRSDRASGATLQITTAGPPQLSADTTGWSCKPITFGLSCSTDSVAAHGSQSLGITYQFPFHEQYFAPLVSVTPTPPAPGIQFPAIQIYKALTFSRWFQVTNTSDSGPGSLRQAIDDVNASCSTTTNPCGIELVIDTPPPPSGWFTLQPLSPLPTIAAFDVRIDGEEQARLNGGPG